MELLIGQAFSGLTATGYGQFIPKTSMPRFKPVHEKRFIQILNVGDHWICVSNSLSKNSHEVYVYDSSYAKINDNLHVQVSALLRGEDDPDEIIYEIRNFQRQSSGSRLCGFYAVAAAVSLINNNDPTCLCYVEDDMSDSYNRLTEGITT